MARLIALLLVLMAVTTDQSAQVLQPAGPSVDPHVELRQCGEPARDASGRIKRSSAVLRSYRKLHPCPATGLTEGACPGWSINHTIPLAKGGCDSVINLSWVPNAIKTCREPHCIDRWERTYYGEPHGIVTLEQP